MNGMGTRTRSQTKIQTTNQTTTSQTKKVEKVENPPVEIIDDDEEEVKTPPPPENKKQQEQQDLTPKSDKQQTTLSSSTTALNRTSTGKSKYFQTIITTPSPGLKSLISDDNNERYDLPDELKSSIPSLPEEKIPIASSSGSVVPATNSSSSKNSFSGKRNVSIFNNKTSLSDDDESSEEEVPISKDLPVSKKKKPNNSTETNEPIVISSMISEIQSIPDDEEIISTITPKKTKVKITENKTSDKTATVNVEVLSSPRKDPIDSKIEKWNDDWKQITESYRISCNNLFEEIFNDLKKDWSLKEENKSRFKQGLEVAGKLMSNNSQKARLFYLTLSYYILFEKKNIQLIGHLYDSLESGSILSLESGSIVSNSLLVSVEFSSIEFEVVCKEYADRKDILNLLQKYYSLTAIEKAKQKSTDNQTNSRLDQLEKIFKHQHSEIMKHQKK